MASMELDSDEDDNIELPKVRIGFKKRAFKSQSGRKKESAHLSDDDDNLDIQLKPRPRKVVEKLTVVERSQEDTPVDEGAPIESIPTILDASMIKELKERRNRAQMDILTQENTDAQEDEDKPDTQSNDLMEVDTDIRYSDGRLALSRGEQKVQALLRRKAIEEALSDSEGTSDDQEVYDSVIPAHLNKKTLAEKYRMPKLAHIPDYETSYVVAKTHLSELEQLTSQNKDALIQIAHQQGNLDSQEEEIRHSLCVSQQPQI